MEAEQRNLFLYIRSNKYVNMFWSEEVKNMFCIYMLILCYLCHIVLEKERNFCSFEEKQGKSSILSV